MMIKTMIEIDAFQIHLVLYNLFLFLLYNPMRLFKFQIILITMIVPE